MSRIASWLVAAGGEQGGWGGVGGWEEGVLPGLGGCDVGIAGMLQWRTLNERSKARRPDHLGAVGRDRGRQVSVRGLGSGRRLVIPTLAVGLGRARSRAGRGSRQHANGNGKALRLMQATTATAAAATPTDLQVASTVELIIMKASAAPWVTRRRLMRGWNMILLQRLLTGDSADADMRRKKLLS